MRIIDLLHVLEGGKLATSSDYNLKRVKGQQGEEFLEVHINESLSLVVTAYQNTTTMIYQVMIKITAYVNYWLTHDSILLMTL